MNLTRALEVALPEIPARSISQRPPRIDPGVTFREHVESGERIVRVYVPCVNNMFVFPPENWELAQLFDGNRSFEEIAELYSQQHGQQYSAEQVQEFAASLDAINFWYKTPQEKNILLMQQSAEERRKKLKQRSRWADLSDVTFPAFNPDRFLTKFYEYTKFIYTTWFTALTLTAFAITAAITITHWQEIGRDTTEFYKFNNKTWVDFVVLYAILFGIVVVHELAHAYTSKHFGGRVTAMGFALVYLTPAVYTDTTEADVMATRQQRLVVTLAGVWSELMICSVATIVWWGTAPDTPVHNGAYFMMMMTGIMSVLLNWNPLIKLDGYYLLTDITGISNIKENSTAYVAAWVKRHFWRLPVEVPYVPKSRRLGFAIYALLSGGYSYMVLYFVARFAGNIVRNFSPEWGFIPEIAVALLIFRSRIRSLVNFMKFLYLDKKDRIAGWFTARNAVIGGAAALILLALPLWRESVPGRFLLEPAHLATIHARVPGMVTEIAAREGEKVAAGAVLADLRNLPMKSDLQHSEANLLMASERARTASMHYADYGSAVKEREVLADRVQQLSKRDAALQIRSPIEGTVITPRIEEVVGTYVTEGQKLLEVADLTSMRARIYISEYDLSLVANEAKARLQVDGLFRTWPGQVLSVAAAPTEIDPRLTGQVELTGMNPPHFYLVDIVVTNSDNKLKPGMAGVARVYGRRRSVFGLAWEAVSNFFGRKLW